MTEPRPAEHFLDLLLKSEEVVAACKAALGERSADVIARATQGDTNDFLEWFEEWRLNDWGDPVEQLEGAAPDNDTFWINIYKTGPLYWIKANEFDAICYFDSADDALTHAADEFEGFISELAEREVEEDEEHYTMRRICPHPIPWNTIYEQLLKVAQERSELPKPPVPLILNGWAFSSDTEKSDRWLETVKWAQAAGCASVLESLSAKDFYHASLSAE